MTWVKVEDDAPTHLKMREVGLEGFGLWLAGLCFCARYRTDGRIDKRQLQNVWPWLPDGTLMHDPQILIGVARKLTELGLWEDKGTHWRVHDYLEYQESRREIDRKRAAARERQRAHRQRFLPKKAELPQHLADSSVTRDSARSHAHESAILPGRVGTGRDGSGSSSPESGSGVRVVASEVADAIRRKFEEGAATLGVRIPGGITLSSSLEHLMGTAMLRYDLDSVLTSFDRAVLLIQHGDDRTWRRENFRLEVLLKSEAPDNIARALNAPVPGSNGHAKPKSSHVAVSNGKEYPCSCDVATDHDGDFKPVRRTA